MTSTTATPRPAAPAGGRSVSARRRYVGLVGCAVLLVIACIASVAVGTRLVPFGKVVRGVLDPSPDDLDHAAVQARLARTCAGLLIGASLGLAGAVMQGVTRNPLADPGLLGISTGASFAVVLGLAVAGLSTPRQYVWCAFAGAAVASLVVYAVGSAGRAGATPLKLALAGAAVAAAFSSLISMVLLVRRDVFEVFRFWQVGGIGRPTLSVLTEVLPFLVVGTLLALACVRGMNTLALGDDLARGLGSKVGVVRLVGWVAVVLLCGAATAAAGPIAFLGLAVPHLARMLAGPDYRWVLPLSALFGATLLLLADVLGRVVARPADLDVGVMTALLGAPVFIAIVRRARVREL